LKCQAEKAWDQTPSGLIRTEAKVLLLGEGREVAVKANI
jgi:hypothetical protein